MVEGLNVYVELNVKLFCILVGFNLFLCFIFFSYVEVNCNDLLFLVIKLDIFSVIFFCGVVVWNCVLFLIFVDMVFKNNKKGNKNKKLNKLRIFKKIFFICII